MQIQQFLPIIIMFAIFYFLLIRPQQKRNKTRNMMLSSLKKGDKVVTIGGMHGTIQEINDQSVTLRIAHNVNVTFDRGAVNAVSSASPTTEKAESSTPAIAQEATKEESKS